MASFIKHQVVPPTLPIEMFEVKFTTWIVGRKIQHSSFLFVKDVRKTWRRLKVWNWNFLKILLSSFGLFHSKRSSFPFLKHETVVKFYEIFIFIATYRPISIMCHKKTLTHSLLSEIVWEEQKEQKKFSSVNICRRMKLFPIAAKTKSHNKRTKRKKARGIFYGITNH